MTAKSVQHYIVVIVGLTFLFQGCKPNAPKETVAAHQIDVDSLMAIRYSMILDYPADSMSFPRSIDLKSNSINLTESSDWTSGFFPGSLWYLYELTGNVEYKEKAIKWTAFIEKEKKNGGTHDMGFKVFCSFGNGSRLLPYPEYDSIIVQSAKTLAKRFNPKVGAIRSWDFNADTWEFPVIIDNMMNLELLFEATKISGDSAFHKMAVEHANTTLTNHFRSDDSSYHVVVYDSIEGSVKAQVTHQGFSNESDWSRGQAWAIYGFTMVYRYSNNEKTFRTSRAYSKVLFGS